MRLIDGKELADEILGKIYERGQASGLWEKQLEIGAITYRDVEFADGYDKALDDVYEKINDVPTVKAIPVEWLYQKRTLYLENECYMSLMVINEILNWWEKENEVSQR